MNSSLLPLSSDSILLLVCVDCSAASLDSLLPLRNLGGIGSSNIARPDGWEAGPSDKGSRLQCPFERQLAILSELYSFLSVIPWKESLFWVSGLSVLSLASGSGFVSSMSTRRGS